MLEIEYFSSLYAHYSLFIVAFKRSGQRIMLRNFFYVSNSKSNIFGWLVGLGLTAL